MASQDFQTQPISAVNSSPSAAYAGEASQTPQESKPRFTRAERREFQKTKKADARKPTQPVRPTGQVTLQKQTIDELIAFLVSIRNEPNIVGFTPNAKSLESRATKEAPPKIKKEKTEKQLQKIQKRREVRLQKRQEKLAAKQATGEQSKEPAPTGAPPNLSQQQPLPDFDEINYDDL